jgi:hypothetical protein
MASAIAARSNPDDTDCSAPRRETGPGRENAQLRETEQNPDQTHVIRSRTLPIVSRNGIGRVQRRALFL